MDNRRQMIRKTKINLTELDVFFINMDRDVDKRRQIEEMLSRLGFKSVHRVAGFEDPVKKRGVAKSHQKVMNDLKGHTKPFIVFEDDIRTHNFIENLAVPDDAHAYYLGNSYWGLYHGKGTRRVSLEQVDQDLFRIYNMLAAHAILYLNPDYVAFIAEAIKFNLYADKNQDMARANTMKFFNIYANKHPLFYQNGIHTKATLQKLPPLGSVGPEGAY